MPTNKSGRERERSVGGEDVHVQMLNQSEAANCKAANDYFLL